MSATVLYALLIPLLTLVSLHNFNSTDMLDSLHGSIILFISMPLIAGLIILTQVIYSKAKE